MNLKMYVLPAGIVLLAILCLSLNGQQVLVKLDNAAIEAAVLKTYEEITDAAESVNGEKIFSYVLENDKGCLISDGKLVMTRQEAIENYNKNSRNLASIDYIMEKKLVTVLSPEMAVMAVEGRYEATTTDGQTFGSNVAQTVIFVLKDDQWKVLHSHTSLPPRP